MINYSIVMRNASANSFEINKAKNRIHKALDAHQIPDPNDEALVASEIRKAYALAQYRSVVSLNDFAKYIVSRGCVYSRIDVSGILTLAVDRLRELLLNGEKVQLGELGNFYVTLKSKGAETANDFNAALNIKGVKVKWEPTEQFDDLIQDAEFKLVPPHKENDKLIKALRTGEKLVINEMNGEDGDRSSISNE